MIFDILKNKHTPESPAHIASAREALTAFLKENFNPQREGNGSIMMIDVLTDENKPTNIVEYIAFFEE